MLKKQASANSPPKVSSNSSSARTPAFVPLSKDSIYTGIDEDDVRFLSQFKVDSKPLKGFVTDFVGSRTDTTINKYISGFAGLVEDVPVPRSFHAEAIEWVGSLRPVAEAKDTFCVCEIGAGWGPWIVATALAARRRGLEHLRMLALEPDPGHLEFLREHVAKNGLDDVDLEVFAGVAAPGDGSALFPVIDSRSEWGASAVFETPSIPSDPPADAQLSRYRRVNAFSLQSILAGCGRVDLVHMDIQGAERTVIPAGLDVLGQKVKWLVVGTHSRVIEGELIAALSADGWHLTNEKPCRFDHADGTITEMNTTIDGTQVWRNTRFS